MEKLQSTLASAGAASGVMSGLELTRLVREEGSAALNHATLPGMVSGEYSDSSL